MKMKKILLAVLLFGIASHQSVLKAQNYSDVLRYSQKNPQGTARSIGIGGAFGALGADFSSLSNNPAGLGLYRQQEVSFSLGMNKQSSTTKYLGSEAGDDKYNFAVHNLGMVLSDVKMKLGKPVQDGWVAVNFGIGFNRTNNFNSRVAVEGVNTSSSITQSWAETATEEGRRPSDMDPFSYQYLGWKTYLIDHLGPDSTKYASPWDEYDSGYVNVKQADYITTGGSMNDIALSVAGNYSNKLYVGAGILFPTIGYHYNRVFSETNLNPNSDAMKYGELTENVRTSGIGISMNAGIIYRATDNFRLGGAVQLPTFYSLTDNYSYSVNSKSMDGQSFTGESPAGRFKYSIVTPMRSTLSAAYLFGKQGFISADYEIVNFASARINTTYDGSRDENNMIRKVYHSASTVRIGGEYRYDNFAFRAGYQYTGSPYKSEYVSEGYNGAGNVYSAGIGVRDGDYFLDLGYQYRADKYFHLPYSMRNKAVEGADVTSSRSGVVVTVGSRF
jgi:hypothetical protein